MPLNNVRIEAAKPRSRPYKLGDEKVRRPEKTLSLGVYPEVSLKRARERRDEARKLLADGIDPSAPRKAAEHAHLFAAAIRRPPL